LLTLGPHAFYWFVLQRDQTAESTPGSSTDEDLPKLTVHVAWQELLRGRARTNLEGVLRNWLVGRRWFGGKARPMQSLAITDAIPLGTIGQRGESYMLLVTIDYLEGEPETYLVPLCCATGDESARLAVDIPQAALARVQFRDSKESGILFDAVGVADFSTRILEMIKHKERLEGGSGELAATAMTALESRASDHNPPLNPTLAKAEQSNSCVTFGDQFILKFFRRVEPGVNPDLEISRFLTGQTDFANTPKLAGYVEYQLADEEEPSTLGILQTFIPDSTTAWQFTLDSLGRYFEQVMALGPDMYPGEESAAPASSRVREGASDMFAYRAGRSPRYYVIGLAASRASSFEFPLRRSLSPSSIG
jgi:maltose alpha-D-glucosyltransferase/alpha-amylase